MCERWIGLGWVQQQVAGRHRRLSPAPHHRWGLSEGAGCLGSKPRHPPPPRQPPTPQLPSVLSYCPLLPVNLFKAAGWRWPQCRLVGSSSSSSPPPSATFLFFLPCPPSACAAMQCRLLERRQSCVSPLCSGVAPPSPPTPGFKPQADVRVCRKSALADVREANVMVTAALWRLSSDRNVKTHVFVRRRRPLLVCSRTASRLEVNVYLYL